MSVDVKKGKSPSSARKSLFAPQQATDALFPELPSHYPDLRTLHADDPYVQAFERDFIYDVQDHPLLASPCHAPTCKQNADSRYPMHAALLPAQWATRMGAQVEQYEHHLHPNGVTGLAGPDEPLTEDSVALFDRAFPQHELVIREALRQQAIESFCESLATEIVECAACHYAARRLDAVKNAYTALAMWDEVRDAVAASFLPRDTLHQSGATADTAGSPMATTLTRSNPRQASFRAVLTAAELVARSRPQSVLPTPDVSQSAKKYSAVSVVSPGAAPTPVPIDHFCRYVVEQLLSQVPHNDDLDEDCASSQPRASSAAQTRMTAGPSRPPEKDVPVAAQHASAPAAGERYSASAVPARTKPMTARKPTPPPKLAPGSAGGRGPAVTTAATGRLTTQDDLTIALHKVDKSAAATSNFALTAPVASAAPSAAASRDGTRTGTLPSKKEAAVAQKRKPLYTIVGPDAFPAHEVEKERARLQSRRIQGKAKTEPVTSAAAAPGSPSDTTYHFAATTTPAAGDAQRSRSAAAEAPPAEGESTPEAAAAPRMYMTADAKRTAQVKEKQRLKRMQEQREQRFVNLADGEATRALLEHQLDVAPQPGVTVRQADDAKISAAKRGGGRQVRRNEEPAVLATGGDYIIPDGKRTWSDATGAKPKASGRPRDSHSRSSHAASGKGVGEDGGKLPRVR